MSSSSCCVIGYHLSDFCFQNNEMHPLCSRIRDALSKELIALHRDGVRQFYIGCHMGTDLWAGEALAAMKRQGAYQDMEIIFVIAFAGYNHEFDDETILHQNSILSVCDRTETVSPIYKPGIYKKSYQYTIDRAQSVLAVCRYGSNEKSDIMSAVGYARKQKKHVTLIHPETAKVTSV